MIIESPYFNLTLSQQEIENNHHRNLVGGIWEEQGQLQLDVSLKYGLKPNMKFLDIGCGSLRGGVKFIDYLDKHNYFGIDASKGLIEAGLNYEVPKHNLQNKVKFSNFILDYSFSIERFNTTFDMGMAQSIFTHVPLNYLYYFLIKSFNFFKKDSKIIFTLWLCDEYEDITKEKTFTSENFEIITQHLSPPYHYKTSQISSMFTQPDIKDKWNLEQLTDIHPRKQTFFLITRC